MPLIEIKGLKVFFHTDDGVMPAVNGVDFVIEREKTLGLVGESGCGKSVTAMSIMGLVQSPPGKVEAGEILYHRNSEIVDLTKLDPTSAEMRSIRGNEIAFIFQEPMTSLNPVLTIGNQIVETIRLHQKLNKKEARRKTIQVLKAVGIPSPETRIDEYPHQLSGGMRQRAMIAMALSCNPSLLIADEPTTALDVTIQAQVLKLMNRLRKEFKTSILFITHDLGVIAQMADDVAVMYLGKVVEYGQVRDIFHDPRHPYTKGLMRSIPSLEANKEVRLETIEGVVPDLYDLPKGCGFEPRCGMSLDICKEKAPDLEEASPGHKAACWRRMEEGMKQP
jgi:peptide/nickel transport system ATP-binding protein/oligopeptide transport system ATP-binding protein